MNTYKPLNHSGRSMLEMLGVLSIVGILSITGITGFTKAIERNKINTAISQINAISAKITAMGSNSSSYEGLSNTAVIKFKATPNEMVSSSSTLTNPFGGAVTVSAGKYVNANDNLAYVIRYDGLSKTECLTLASHDWGSSNTSSLIGVAAGKTSNITSAIDSLYKKCAGTSASGYAAACNKGSDISVPMTISIATNACLACTNGVSCSIAIKYY